MQQQVYDAIVIGSGITGGWAAKELTERGLQTLVLEAGPDIVPERDYGEHVAPWEMRYRGWGDRKQLERDQPVQRRCYACDEVGYRFFVKDTEHPYTTDADKPFDWIRGRQVGGRSIMWGRQCYRWSDLDFEANARDGYGVDWPIRYADIAPWYDYVESFVGITGHAEGLAHLPDGKFLPPMQMNCVETHIRDALPKLFGGERMMTIGRAAVLTVDHHGRAACHYCGPCHRGCITRSYFSSLNATLPAAQRTGRLTLRPGSIVRSIAWDGRAGRAGAVQVIDATTRQSLEFRGRVIFLCASTLESARVLLNSTSTEWPAGLGNSSGEVGHNLMDHTMGGNAGGTYDRWQDRDDIGTRPNGIYVPRFRNVRSRHPDFVRGYGMQGGGGRDWSASASSPGFGAEFKQRLSRKGSWSMWIGGWGECLPRHENHVEIDPAKVDAWGVPTLKIHCAWSDNEKAMVRDAGAAAAEMLEATGARDIQINSTPTNPGLCIHEMGTARMGRDPKTSVLNGFNQMHDVKNVFITDGACMTSSACQNPSITYMALTARAVDHAVGLLNRREL